MFSFPTENKELDVLGNGAQTVASCQAVEGTVQPAGLLDEQRTLVLRYQFVHVLVVLDAGLFLGLGHAGTLPGERGEGTSAHLGHHANVTTLLTLQNFSHLDGWST